LENDKEDEEDDQEEESHDTIRHAPSAGLFFLLFFFS
jgi:hypothetical protein